MFRQETEQFLVGSQIHIGTTAIVFDDLGGATVGRDDHTTDLVVLNGFNKIAVPHGADFRLRAGSAPDECGGDHHDRENQQGG